MINLFLINSYSSFSDNYLFWNFETYLNNDKLLHQITQILLFEKKFELIDENYIRLIFEEELKSYE